jgi:hypothetical protein
MGNEDSGHRHAAGEAEAPSDSPQNPISVDPESGNSRLSGSIGYELTSLEIKYLLQKGTTTEAELTSIQKLTRWGRIYGIISSVCLGILIKTVTTLEPRTILERPSRLLESDLVIPLVLTILFVGLFFLTGRDTSDLKEEIATEPDLQGVINEITS